MSPQRGGHRWGAGLRAGLMWMGGGLSLWVGLALACSVPGGNLLTLGYLVHAGGRVATTGRLREGFVGVQKASRLAGILVGTWLVWLPVRWIADLSRDAAIIEPGSRRAAAWSWVAGVLGAAALMQIAHAMSRGGRLRHFLLPTPWRLLRECRSWRLRWPSLRDLRERASRVRWHQFLWTGLQVDLGVMLCLAVPTLFLVGATRSVSHGTAVLLSLAGIISLMWVAGWLPLAQARFGMAPRFRTLLAAGEVSGLFRAAPFACWLATTATLASAVPLYLLRVELPSRDLAWLPALPFVLTAFCTRLLGGWATFRATHTTAPPRQLWVWTARLGTWAIVLVYAISVTLSQYVSWNGSLDLLRQQAFLMPGLWNPS